MVPGSLPPGQKLARLGAHLSGPQLCRAAPHPVIRELGRPVQPVGSGWAVPKLGSCARNQARPRGRVQRAEAGCLGGNQILVSSSVPGKPVPSPQAGWVALRPADHRCPCCSCCLRAASPPPGAPRLPSCPGHSRLSPGSQLGLEMWPAFPTGLPASGPPVLPPGSHPPVALLGPSTWRLGSLAVLQGHCL